MKLEDGKKNIKYKILSIEGGCRSKDRLIKLGLIPGSIITIERSAPLKGPFMVDVSGSKIVVGRGIASRIDIEEIF